MSLCLSFWGREDRGAEIELITMSAALNKPAYIMKPPGNLKDRSEGGHLRGNGSPVLPTPSYLVLQ